MSAAARPGGMTDAELAALQAAMLRSALGGAPLPGAAGTIELPDRGFLPREGPAPLADENLSPELARALPEGVRIVAPGELPRGGGAGGDTAYLRFQPPSEDAGTVWLTLELRLAPREGDAARARPLGLGGAQVGVRRVGGAWEVAEPPRGFAV